MKLYEYKNCSTCRKASKYLDARKLVYQQIAIIDCPPSIAELKQMLNHLKSSGGTFKNLFNTSGLLYRELKIADKIKAGMTELEAIKLLSLNGKLIKRPFLLTKKTGVVGFNQKLWDQIL